MNHEGLTGRDLDKAVAQAFGFQPRITWEILNVDETGTMIGFEREAAARKWWDEHPYARRDHHIGTWEHYEPYSESIEAAMRVAEKMWQLGWQVEITNHHKLHTRVEDKISAWYVRFVGALDCQDDWSGESESLPAAICRAALKAIEQSKAVEPSNELKGQAMNKRICDTAKMVKDKVDCRICFLCGRCAVHDGLMMRCPACEKPRGLRHVEGNTHCRRDANAAAKRGF